MDILKFLPHHLLEALLQICNGTVQKKDPRTAHHGTSQKRPVCLLPGQLLRLFIQNIRKLQIPRDLPDPPVNLLLGHLPHTKRKGKVIFHRHARIQHTVFKQHGNIPVLGIRVRHILSINEKGTGADLIQSADHPQKRGFSAPGRPHKDKELPVPDLQRKILHRLLSPRINLIHVF